MKQITILSRDLKNPVSTITQMLAAADIGIESIAGESYGGQSVITLTLRDYEEALKLLSEDSNLQIMAEDALIVRIEDETGALAKLSRRFADAGIEINSIRFVERHEGYALVAVSTERTEEALALVKDILVS